MGTRPRTQRTLQLKKRRCTKCGKTLNKHIKRCKRCSSLN